MEERFFNLSEIKYKNLITEKEFEHVCTTLKREPNQFELFLFSATYSEHCSYKHSKEFLKLLPRESAIFYDENAGGIELGKHAILFKMESHNHPCAVEPYNGAATGVGGIIRDVLAMNARPIALCNSLKFGTKSKRIKNGVVKGISDYGNCIGVPTVSTEVLLDDCFEENPLVNVTAIGIAKLDDILVSSNAKVGLKLMLVGSATMRDGMGGAVFASKELSDEKAEDKISIQIANPFMKKKLIEACLEIFKKKLVTTCQDCGAAGILSSTSEIAYKSSCGVEIDLEKIHTGDKTIKDFEIMLSETQERMLFAVEEQNIKEIQTILKKYQLESSIIGETIADKKYIVRKNGENKSDLPTDLLITPPSLHSQLILQSHQSARANAGQTTNGNSPEIYEQYDHTVGARTQFQPSENPQFNSLWISEENCYLGVYTFSAVIQKNSYKDVYESLINAADFLKEKGYTPKGITDCLNFANPEIPPTMYEFKEAINAIKDACEEINIPVCSGNVSFYNEWSSGRIKNTPTFTMIGIKHSK